MKIKEIKWIIKSNGRVMRDRIQKLKKGYGCWFCKNTILKGCYSIRWVLTNEEFNKVCLTCALKNWTKNLEDYDCITNKEDLERFKKDYAKELVIEVL